VTRPGSPGKFPATPVPERKGDGLDDESLYLTQRLPRVLGTEPTVPPPLTVPPPEPERAEPERPGATAASGKAALSDGLALSISGAVGSVAGLISWLIAARIMPQESVGYASAFVSAFLLVAGTAQLNLDAGNMIWLPKAGRRAGTLFWRSHAVIVPACVVVGLVYVWFVPSLAETGSGPDWPTAVGVVLFVLAAAGWGLWGLHDYTLVAVGRPWWAPGRSVAFAVVRIGLLLALGVSLGPLGVVLSWVVPIVVWAVGSALVAGYQTRRFSRITDDGWLPTRSEVVGFLGPTTIAHWGTVLLFNQVTVIVIQRFGPGAGAAFFMAWQAVMVIDIAAQRFMQSLSAQVARDPDNVRAHIAASRRRLFVIFLPMVLLGIGVADLALYVFGPGYAEAGDVLRLLLIGMIPRLLIAHELGVRQALHEGMAFARLQLASTLLVIAVVVFVPITAADPAAGFQVTELWPLAIGYTATQLLCAVVVLVLVRRRRVHDDAKAAARKPAQQAAQ
jgi:O-antigen/teichoic acid export membrane protein